MSNDRLRRVMGIGVSPRASTIATIVTMMWSPFVTWMRVAHSCHVCGFGEEATTPSLQSWSLWMNGLRRKQKTAVFNYASYPFPQPIVPPADPSLTMGRAALNFLLSFLQQAWSNLGHLYELSTTPRADKATIPIVAKTTRHNCQYDEEFVRRSASAPINATG